MSRTVSRTGNGIRYAAWAALALVAAACGDSILAPTGPDTEVEDEFRQDGVLFTATARYVDGDSIEVTLTVMNETDTFAQTGILGGNCMLRPRIYRERDGALLWSAFDLFDGCQEPLRLFQLDGGDEDSETRRFAVDLRGGDYFVTLTIEALELVELAAGVVTIG